MKLHEYVKEVFNKRSTKDLRKRVDWYLVEYKDTNNVPYRKGYEFKPGTPWAVVKKQIPTII